MGMIGIYAIFAETIHRILKSSSIANIKFAINVKLKSYLVIFAKKIKQELIKKQKNKRITT
jgi:hypothetical protein